MESTMEFATESTMESTTEFATEFATESIAGPSPRSNLSLRSELPLIYQTDIPEHFQNALMNDTHNVIVLTAPTGLGKTVMVNQIMALVQKSNPEIQCTSLMPFRVSVVEMYQYLNKLFPSYKFGYAMRGENMETPIDNVRLNTVGYWLERAMKEFCMCGLPKTQQIIMVDEAHDGTWQTDLTIRLLIWQQKQGAKIKIVITSATLDITNTLRGSNIDPLILSVTDQEANVDINYMEEIIRSLDKNKLSKEMITAIIKTLDLHIEQSQNGDILIMLPGQDEIESLIETLNNKPNLKNFKILPLYSTLQKEDINLAINPDVGGCRKIIVATNIVENAITISNLMCCIDCGYRKINKVDKDGVQELVLTEASKSNMRQCLGRVGRQGKRGVAYLMLTKLEFELRQPFSENEVQRNPLYQQIIKLTCNGFPVKEVLSHVNFFRIDRDILFLVDHGALEMKGDGFVETAERLGQSHLYDSAVTAERLGQGRFVVTDLGKIMAQLPLSIRASHFLALVITTLPPSLWYSAIVSASWFDSNTSIFYRPRRNRNETEDAYKARLQQIEDTQFDENLFEDDCISTMLKIWYMSWTFVESKGGFHEWCKQMGLFDRTLKNIQRDTNHIITSLENMDFVIPMPTYTQCVEFCNNIQSITRGLVPALIPAYKDRQFNLCAYGEYCQVGSIKTFDGTKYNIDKFLKNLSIIKKEFPVSIIALNLRRIGPNRILMSNIVNVTQKENCL
jgi:HrpA-like RNA helicase